MTRSMRVFVGIVALSLLAIIGGVPPPTAGLAADPPLVVRVLDIGQGDAILVEFPNGDDMLVDAGDKAHGPAVVQYLKHRQLDDIDILVATHPHEDHIGGMLDVLRTYKVGRVWDSGYNHGSHTQQRFLQAIKDHRLQYGQPRAGFVREVGKVRIEVLAPGRNLLKGTESDANNNSLVLRVSYGEVSFLLTGDIEEDGRAAVAAWPRATVLKVSHHGSRNGTDGAWLRKVKPTYAAISCGRNNNYNHPHAETLRALVAAGVQTQITAQDGTIVYATDGKTVTVATQPAAAAAGGGQPEGQYIGNQNSHVFHLPTCGSLPAEKNRVYFRTRQEAIDAGHRPCGRCKP